MLDPRAIAVQGVGFAPGVLAVQGLAQLQQATDTVTLRQAQRVMALSGVGVDVAVGLSQAQHTAAVSVVATALAAASAQAQRVAATAGTTGTDAPIVAALAGRIRVRSALSAYAIGAVRTAVDGNVRQPRGLSAQVHHRAAVSGKATIR